MHDRDFTVEESNKLYDIFNKLFEVFLDADPDEVSLWSDMVVNAYNIINTAQMRANGKQSKISRTGLLGICEIFEDEWHTVYCACQAANLPQEDTQRILDDWVSLVNHELDNSYATYNVRRDVLEENGLTEAE